MVKDVLGDAGKDWCTIQELHTNHEVRFEPQDSLMSPLAQPASSNTINEMAYVMPILDFSSSFLATDSLPPSFSDDTSDCTFPLILASVGGEESAPPSSSPWSFSDGGSDYSFPSIPDDESVQNLSAHTPSLSPSAADEWYNITRSSTSASSSWPSFSSEFATRACSESGAFF